MKTFHCIVERVDFDVSMCASLDFCIRDDISEFARREYVCGAFTLRPYSVVNIIKITEWGQLIFQSTLNVCQLSISGNMFRHVQPICRCDWA